MSFLSAGRDDSKGGWWNGSDGYLRFLQVEDLDVPRRVARCNASMVMGEGKCSYWSQDCSFRVYTARCFERLLEVINTYSPVIEAHTDHPVRGQNCRGSQRCRAQQVESFLSFRGIELPCDKLQFRPSKDLTLLRSLAAIRRCRS